MSAAATYAAVPFEASGSLAVKSGAAWLVSLATGTMAVGLCVLAIATIGLLMLGGRLPVRDGLRVVLVPSCCWELRWLLRLS